MVSEMTPSEIVVMELDEVRVFLSEINPIFDIKWCFADDIRYLAHPKFKTSNKLRKTKLFVW